jgi:UDPglucose 6-dehydrogenase
MKLAIVGNDSLARATEECCRRHFNVVLPHEGIDVLWVAYDTPIGKDDKSDVEWVFDRIRQQVVDFDSQQLILISSQLPVGSTALLEQEFPYLTFAYSPENVRVATAVADFENQARVIVGVRTNAHNELLKELFAPFTKNLILTTPETAEMCKAALNCYLALCITFSNELARICEVVGADAMKVSEALKCEPRVSLKAPLRPGAPYGGGHLAREIYNLTQIASKAGIKCPVIGHIKESNDGV